MFDFTELAQTFDVKFFPRRINQSKFLTRVLKDVENRDKRSCDFILNKRLLKMEFPFARASLNYCVSCTLHYKPEISVKRPPSTALSWQLQRSSFHYHFFVALQLWSSCFAIGRVCAARTPFSKKVRRAEEKRSPGSTRGPLSPLLLPSLPPSAESHRRFSTAQVNREKALWP